MGQSCQECSRLQEYPDLFTISECYYQSLPTYAVLGSVSDSRVTYWEPAKWVAKLRALRTNDNVLMLRTDMSSGHSGVTGRYRGLEGVAMIYAFAIKTVGGSRCSIR